MVASDGVVVIWRVDQETVSSALAVVVVSESDARVKSDEEANRENGDAARSESSKVRILRCPDMLRK